MYRRILIAFDGSDAASKAFDAALDLAKRFQAELHALSVAPVPEVGDEVEGEAWIEQARRRHKHLLQLLNHRADAAGQAVQLELQVGHAAQQIIEHAQALQADLIVVGHRGHGPLDRWRLGSVSHRVISYAECAVLVVR